MGLRDGAFRRLDVQRTAQADKDSYYAGLAHVPLVDRLCDQEPDSGRSQTRPERDRRRQNQVLAEPDQAQ